jgi:DNA modification methylase
LDLTELSDAEFDIDLLGFDAKDLDALIGNKEGLTDPDEVPEDPETPVSKEGDLWLLENHRLLCGDSGSDKSVLRCVGGVDVDMVFTSPPYNVGIDYGKYDDKKGANEYKSLIESVICNCFSVLGEGRLLAWNVGVSPKSKPHHHMIWLENAGFDLFRHIVWKKTGAQIPLWQNSKKKPYARNYKPNYNHEMIYMVSKGDVCYGSSTQMPSELSMDVWDVAQFSAGGKGHPAAFPAKLATLAVDVMSAPGEIILEPFCGSGTMIIAAEVKGRKCCAIEMDPIYVDVAVARWENFTGKDAKLETGETFKEKRDAQAH